MSTWLTLESSPPNPLQGRIRLGLCCINTILRKRDIFCSRTTTRKHFTVEKAQKLSLQNIKDIEPMVLWNYKNGIEVMRLSSDIFPHYTDTETTPYNMEFAIPELQRIGEICNIYNHRITMHPGQFNQVGAKSREVFEKTVYELGMHCDILDHMGICYRNGIVNIHGGGVYGDKEGSIRRWIDQFDELPTKVKRRLTIENCEKCYSADDCLEIARACKIPVCFDTHHYDCYTLLHPQEKQRTAEEIIPEILETWDSRRGIPLFHISEQRADCRTGAHSDYIEKIPDYLLEIPVKYGVNIDIDVEAKMKEQSIIKLYEKYEFLKCQM